MDMTHVLIYKMFWCDGRNSVSGLQPDVSIASIALRHGINANLMRKWTPLYRDRQPDALPAFLPLTMKPESEPLEATGLTAPRLTQG